MEDAVQQHKDQQDKNELLTWACARGLLADAEAQVSGGADPHAVDKAGRRPLHYAAAHGHLKVVEFLITRGADLEADDPSGRTALHYAALGRHLAVVSLLCERGCWVDAPDATDCTALHLAARGLPPGPDDRAAARKAAGAGAASSPWATLGGGSGREGPWHAASGPLVKVLAAAGAALNSRNACGLSPAGEAVVAGNAHALAVLVDLGALITPTYRGYTLLHLAAALGHSQCLERLLAAGRRPDLQEADNPEGLTPLHAAALGGAAGCVALLLDKG
ncbi:ankyrin repeat-containing domain protein, partial [Haematococcus lacustris]